MSSLGLVLLQLPLAGILLFFMVMYLRLAFTQGIMFFLTAWAPFGALAMLVSYMYVYSVVTLFPQYV